jgi:glucans biosynthesis protein C
MQTLTVGQQSGPAASRGPRLYYLDWLRVLATLGVFLFHVTNIFNTFEFEIKNAEGSETISIIQSVFFPWGMPLFFLVAGAGSWFALRRRTASQFTRERTFRLLVPFLAGTILLGPIQLFLSWLHRTEIGIYDGTFGDFVMTRLSYTGPKLFGAVGYHMWFLGFLFAYALLALPLFMWLKGDRGGRLISRLAGLCRHRGAILLFAVLPMAMRLGLHPFFPQQQHWADFFTFFSFFVLGFLMFADERFTQAIRRDWWISLTVSLVAMAVGVAIGTSFESFDIETPPATLAEVLLWATVGLCGWSWTIFMLFIGMRFRDRNTKGLRYCLEIMLPFFVVHQPVVLAVGYFVVQWQASIPVKLLTVGVGAFVISVALVEFIIKRVGILRLLFGMKEPRPVQVQIAPA